jgi:hypothetical protein
MDFLLSADFSLDSALKIKQVTHRCPACPDPRSQGDAWNRTLHEQTAHAFAAALCALLKTGQIDYRCDSKLSIMRCKAASRSRSQFYSWAPDTVLGMVLV